MAHVHKMPEPPGYPIIGNLTEFVTSPVKDLSRLADTYGEVYRFYFGTKPTVLVSSQKLVHEVCDEKRFRKSLKTVLKQVRFGITDGLFTADEDEPNWGKAHRVLIPAFGPLPIRGMFDDMYDIATQLALKFARHGPQAAIPVAEDFTRLALDTIALCAMNYRFNSFYSEELHPFIRAMTDFLVECGCRNRRPSVMPGFLHRKATEKFEADIAIMRDTADEVVRNRQQNPDKRKDLLASMLEGVDSRTGEKLDSDNITSQLITFLIAGHETTSGTMSFAFYMLLKHPSAHHKVQQEVDRVIGRGPVEVDHLNKLPYTAAVIKETLRMCAPIPGFTVEAIDDTLLEGKYLISKGEPVIALLAKSHKDPAVFGDDAEDFKPERMLDENFSRLGDEFPDFWKPFGNGKRGCIGRPFALQEIMLSMAILFQNFDFSLADPDYQLDVQETLTIKPRGLCMHASLRHGMTATELEHSLAGRGGSRDDGVAEKGNENSGLPTKSSLKPLAVFFGSNSGTCEALARRLARDAPSHGFCATTVGPLDLATRDVPEDRPIVIVTASYDGLPPSNATRFFEWLESLEGQEMEGVKYSVFGCGHHDWNQTFHRVPNLIDSALAERGGSRLTKVTGTDAASRDMFSDFEKWEDDVFWPAVTKEYGATDDVHHTLSNSISVEVSNPRKATLGQDVQEATITAEWNLSSEKGAMKKHMEVQLPAGITFKTGDYLTVLPFNPKQTVARALRYFELSWDSYLKITSEQRLLLPNDTIVSASDILSAYVELSQPATERNIQSLIKSTTDSSVTDRLRGLADERHNNQPVSERPSVLELLEQHSSIKLSLGPFLAMLPPMRTRQYSISSSSLFDPKKATLTYSVLDQPSLSGRSHHLGVASTFLSSLTLGEKLHVSVRPCSSTFRPPTDLANIPMICVAAGSGIAPFRGFFQERAALASKGKELAPAILFFGCRSPSTDNLYAAEFTHWEELGIVRVKRAFSRSTTESKDCKYVQHRMQHDKAEILDLWEQEAKIFVCGGRNMSKAVEALCKSIALESLMVKGATIIDEEAASEWWEKNRNERFVTEIFD